LAALDCKFGANPTKPRLPSNHVPVHKTHSAMDRELLPTSKSLDLVTRTTALVWLVVANGLCTTDTTAV